MPPHCSPPPQRSRPLRWTRCCCCAKPEYDRHHLFTLHCCKNAELFRTKCVGTALPHASVCACVCVGVRVGVHVCVDPFCLLFVCLYVPFCLLLHVCVACFCCASHAAFPTDDGVCVFVCMWVNRQCVCLAYQWRPTVREAFWAF